jgi:hypothetical protein
VEQRRVEVDETRDAWLSIGGPIEDELNTRLEALESAQSQLRVERLQREAWLLENPATVDRLEALDRETQRLELETGLTTPD